VDSYDLRLFGHGSHRAEVVKCSTFRINGLVAGTGGQTRG